MGDFMDTTAKGCKLGLAAAGLLAAIGVAAGGWLAGQGLTRFKAEYRSVTVKGLVEREAPADEATWILSFRRAGDSLTDAQSRIRADREAVLEFLKNRGFKEDEIEQRAQRITDKYAQDTDGTKAPLRYVVTASVAVKTRAIDKVKGSLAATEELVSRGVLLEGGDQGRANPRYAVTRFNDMRPQLLAEATKNARAIAQQFASDSGTTVGRIRSANQGNIQILGTDGNDESGAWAPTSTPVKVIRVVSTFEFELR
jgi:hypothetical protein